MAAKDDKKLDDLLKEIEEKKAAQVALSAPPPFVATPGVHIIDNETYHASEGVSKSGLQTLHTKTPFHFRYGVRVHKSHFDLGDGAHAAILEPERFEADFVNGPDDRRGNKWKDALEEATANNRTLLTSGDYEVALRVRDSAHANPTVRALTHRCLVEHSGYMVDDETGVLVRVRPDAYNPELALIGDLKTTTDASPAEFMKSVANYGYHFQEAMYSDVWANCGGGPVDGFVFMTVEKTAPYPVAVYELERTAVAEGYATYRAALEVYAACKRRDDATREHFASLPATPANEAAKYRALMACWPGYPQDVQRLDIPRWAYKLTNHQEA